jgi:thioredoxin-dependent peroxiredoxin
MRRTTVAVTIALAALALTASAAMLEPGEPFPAWTAIDHTGATVRSSDLAGTPYLLWFYPKAMTRGCTAEGCALRDSFGDFQGAGVQVLGMSFDDPADNAAFRLLSDTTRELGVAVGAADSTEAKYARRVSYLVGADGTVLKAYAQVDPSTHAQQVLEDLKTLAARR